MWPVKRKSEPCLITYLTRSLRPYGYVLANMKQTHFVGEKSATLSVHFFFLSLFL